MFQANIQALVHAIGEVWANMLHECFAALTLSEKYAYTRYFRTITNHIDYLLVVIRVI